MLKRTRYIGLPIFDLLAGQRGFRFRGLLACSKECGARTYGWRPTAPDPIGEVCDGSETLVFQTSVIDYAG